MLQGVRELHRYGMVHRDLKPKNILVANCVGGKRMLKIADFGMGRSIIHGSLVAATPETQTMLYRAPEVFTHVPRYHASVDIWSIACIWTEMHRGRHLVYLQLIKINGNREIELFHFIFATLGQPTLEDWKTIGGDGDCPQSDNQILDLEDLIPGLSKEGVDLMEKMFKYNPTLRITAADALAHAFFRNYQPDLDLVVIEERLDQVI
jgi:serine/threonine protein kinase